MRSYQRKASGRVKIKSLQSLPDIRELVRELMKSLVVDVGIDPVRGH
jgi:hypothetical protein